MTPQEAIYELVETCIVRCAGEPSEDCEECEVEMAAIALGKQEPFKPENKKLVVGVGRCKCGVEFLDKATRYCGNCGQRLDWSDTE